MTLASRAGLSSEGYDPLASLRADRERALEFLVWASGVRAPKAVIDALCRWVQDCDRELARSW